MREGNGFVLGPGPFPQTSGGGQALRVEADVGVLGETLYFPCAQAETQRSCCPPGPRSAPWRPTWSRNQMMPLRMFWIMLDL